MTPLVTRLLRFPTSESLLMLILITPHIQAVKKSKWLISSDTPRIWPPLTVYITACFSKVTDRFLLKNVNQRFFLFSSSLSALHSGYCYVENKIWIFNPCSPGPHKTYSLFFLSHLCSHSPSCLPCSSHPGFSAVPQMCRGFYYRTFALLFLLHEYISLT